MPWLSGVYPQFFWLLNLLWALEIGALRGPSQRALGHTMVQKLAESVALATFLASQLIILIGQLAQSKQVAAKAVWLACGTARDPCSLKAPQGALRLLQGARSTPH